MTLLVLDSEEGPYLEKCLKEQLFSYGIIIGQRATPQLYVGVHLAKTNEEEPDYGADSTDGTQSDSSGQAALAQDVSSIDTAALAAQWTSAYKMLPGSFDVLGIFVCSQNQDILGEKSLVAGKKLLHEIYNMLETDPGFSSVSTEKRNDFIFLLYSTAAKPSCKLYTEGDSGGTYTDVDCSFSVQPLPWHMFECSYDVDDIYPIMNAVEEVNIEQQLQKIVAAVRGNLMASNVFLLNEFVDDDITLEEFLKKKRNKLQGIMRAHIYLPMHSFVELNSKKLRVRECGGTIRFAGIVSSRIWCYAYNKLGDVKNHVRNDILRSLATRIQVYCDGLTESTFNTNAFFTSEPPRRIYFPLHPTECQQADSTTPDDVPKSKSKYKLPTSIGVQFSEYIFRGEAPTVAVSQAKQVLDLDINPEQICTDLEGLSEEDLFGNASSETKQAAADESGDVSSTSEQTRSLYILGAIGLLLVLIITLLLNYLLGGKDA